MKVWNGIILLLSADICININKAIQRIRNEILYLDGSYCGEKINVEIIKYIYIYIWYFIIIIFRIQAKCNIWAHFVKCC